MIRPLKRLCWSSWHMRPDISSCRWSPGHDLPLLARPQVLRNADALTPHERDCPDLLCCFSVERMNMSCSLYCLTRALRPEAKHADESSRRMECG